MVERGFLMSSSTTLEGVGSYCPSWRWDGDDDYDFYDGDDYDYDLRFTLVMAKKLLHPHYDARGDDGTAHGSHHGSAHEHDGSGTTQSLIQSILTLECTQRAERADWGSWCWMMSIFYRRRWTSNAIAMAKPEFEAMST
jgi:hypothetical protein